MTDYVKKSSFALCIYLLACLVSTRAGAGDGPVDYQALAAISDAGVPYLGAADAPVTLIEYSDYLCPYCERHFRQTLPELLRRYAVTGKVRFEFRDFPIVSLHPLAPRAAEAAHCVGEQSASGYWKMHDAIFGARRQFAGAADVDALLEDLAKAVGANLPAYQRCMDSGRRQADVQKHIAAAKALGLNATPSFRFVAADGSGYNLSGAQPVDRFAEWLDAMVAGEAPPQPKPPPPPELPVWATQEGLAPDPQRPGYTLAGDAYRGNPDAEVVVVEFSDLQCPACQRHALQTEPELTTRYIESGQVRWVFKHLPLLMHGNAAVAAAAAECAGDQQKFWEFRHKLFSDRENWADSTEPDEIFVKMADEAGLSVGAFRQCLGGRHSIERVLNDVQHSIGVVSTTPGFVILSNGRGRLINGVRSVADFSAYLDAASELAGTAKK